MRSSKFIRSSMMDSNNPAATAFATEVMTEDKTDHDAHYNTTFLIPNLHCTSCITNIENALNLLEPKPISISHSIVSQFINVSHERDLPVRSIVRALDKAGYEIYHVTSNEPGAETAYEDVKNDANLRDRLVSRQSWSYWGQSQDAHSKKRKRHTENCEHCRKESAQEQEETTKTQQRHAKTKASKVRPQSTEPIIDDAQQVGEKYPKEGDSTAESSEHCQLEVAFELTLDIDGMTCGSCVGNVARALKDCRGIVSVNVNLVAGSATISCEEDYSSTDILDAVEDVGYGATIRDTKPIKHARNSVQSVPQDTFTASFSIGGMTCSSCVNAVRSALSALDFVVSAEVSLVTNSAAITFRGNDRLAELTGAIDDTGFEATLDHLVLAHGPAADADTRKIHLDLKGMYCDHCPMKIKNAVVAKYGDAVQVCDQFSPENPILTLEYKPLQPHLTISYIVSTIKSVDPAFAVTIHHPPSLEERSKRMHSKEQRKILFRLILSILTAIPTFIIGIVYMNLVSKTNSRRQYLMEEWAGVSRAVWALLIMATPVYFFAADLFHRRTLKEVWILWRPGSRATWTRRFLRFGSMSMLISLGTSVAYISSIAEIAVVASKPHRKHSSSSQYFDSVVFLTMFLLLGRYIEAFSKSKANDAVSSLGKLRPTHCLRQTETEIEGKPIFQECPAEFLEFGDVVRIVHGGTPPADGILVEGSTLFDESCLTGEAKPVSKNVGDDVFSGTVNQGQPISVQVTGIAGNSMLDRIMDIVREGQTRRAPVERIADVLTGHFVPLVTAIAIVTWVIWLSLGLSGALPRSYRDTDAGGWTFWSLQFAIASFVIACPCGIGLAAPTALLVGGGLAAKHGILVKGGGEAFQEASQLDTIVFDKTGTLTVGGNPSVTDFEYIERDQELLSRRKNVLGMVKRLEQESSHPIARALVTFVDSQEVSAAPAVGDAEEIPGKGMKAVFFTGDGSAEARTTEDVLLGNEALMNDFGIEIPGSESETLLAWKHQGKSVVILATSPSSSDISQPQWRLQALFAVSDPIRPEATQVIRELHKRKIGVWMLTGDNPTTAHAVGKQLNISPSNIIAGVLPEDKANKIKELQHSLRGRRRHQTLHHRLRRLFGFKTVSSETATERRRALVAMVGDGINDAPALANADVGIAMGSGTDIALHSAKFILLQPSLTTLLTLLALSRTVLRRIKFNFAWALVYNVIGIPIAAGALYPLVSNGQHIRLDPAWAALAMAASSVSVVLSSLSLRSRAPLAGFRAPKIHTATIDDPES